MIERYSNRPPTKRQLQVLSSIVASYRDLGYAPSLRELGQALGVMSVNSAKDHLWACARKGLVTWADGKARTLRVTDAGIKALTADCEKLFQP